jgi:hypothetical protein
MFVSLAMAWDCGDIARRSVDVVAVVDALSKELRTLAFQMTDQVDPYH